MAVMSKPRLQTHNNEITKFLHLAASSQGTKGLILKQLSFQTWQYISHAANPPPSPLAPSSLTPQASYHDSWATLASN